MGLTFITLLVCTSFYASKTGISIVLRGHLVAYFKIFRAYYVAEVRISRFLSPRNFFKLLLWSQLLMLVVTYIISCFYRFHIIVAASAAAILRSVQ